MIDIDREVFEATTRLQRQIDKQAAKISAEMIDHVDEVRRLLRLPRLVFVHSIRPVLLPPSMTCPECGGRLHAEISEWEVISRLATDDSILVICENEDAMDLEAIQHRGYFSDWHIVIHRAERWVQRYVQVML